MNIRRFLAPSIVALLAIAMVLGAYSMSGDQMVAHAQSMGIPAPLPNCAVQVPVGQANPSAEPEPMGQIWCFPLVSEPTTRVSGANDWVDTFDTGVQMGHLNDGEMGYRVFTPAFSSSNAGTMKAQIFVNNNHWMPDIQMLPDASGGNTSPEAGIMLSPSRSFHAENGKLVVEADVAATTGAQGGADNFIELDVAPALPGTTGLDSGEGRDYYGYGNFAQGAVGCRIEKGGATTATATIPVICSLMGSWTLPLVANNTAYYPGAPCATTPNPSGTGWNCLDNVNASPNAKGDGPAMRLWESQAGECPWLGGCTPGQGDMLSNSVVGTSLHGSDFARVCQPNQMDMFCRDRWRMELTKTTLTLFVNGGQVLQLGPLPTSEPSGPQNCDPTCYSNPQAGRNAQIPDAILNSAHVYYTTWVNYIDGPGQPALTRTHWGRVAVNPHNADGSPAAPSASPSYCYGMPQNTCAMGGTPMTNPTPMPSATTMPVPPTVASPTPVPTMAMPTVVPSPATVPATPVPTMVPSPVPPSPSGTTTPPNPAAQTTLGFDDLSNPNRVLSGQYPAGVIDWGSTAWWLSAPWGAFRTNSVSFNGSGPLKASFNFLTPRRLVSLDAYNGDASPATVTLSCNGQPTVTGTVPMGSEATISTGWTGACLTVSIGTSNGWDTNFDNLVIQ